MPEAYLWLISLFSMSVVSPLPTHNQLALFKPGRGGKRRGAGRPPKGPRAGSPHKARPSLSGREPVHVTLRVVSAVGGLRRPDAYRAIREATCTAARRTGFRIVHLSIQQTHLHLIVEAERKEALASGMQAVPDLRRQAPQRGDW